jgi:ketosteroid isomerase-like protein
MITRRLGSILWIVIVAAALGADQKEAERYIVASERQWAESVATGDSSVVERILADDFIGVDPDGNFYDRAKMIADTKVANRTFLSNHLDEVKVRFYGDTAVAQGSETWERRTGTPKRGRFVWTDTWVLRNGKWQIVAAEDLIAPPRK